MWDAFKQTQFININTKKLLLSSFCFYLVTLGGSNILIPITRAKEK